MKEGKRIDKIEKELKEIWRVMRERDDYLFEVISKDIRRLEEKNCLCCGKKISENAKWCTMECKKKFILAHIDSNWFKEDKKDIIAFLEEYLRVFKNKKEHQKVHKRESCPKCKLAESLLRKLKNVRPMR